MRLADGFEIDRAVNEARRAARARVEDGTGIP